MSKDCKDPEGAAPGTTRRVFISAAAGVAAALPYAKAMARDGADSDASDALAGPGSNVAVELTINGRSHQLSLDPRTSLLDALRDHIGLTGSKKGCDHGQCGACTVHINGQRVLSCLTLAVMAGNHQITTIEGLSGPGDELHPMQQAFIDHDAFQCGYCTPGQIMSAIACVAEGHAESADAIREYMSGNLCRCAAYPNIVAAIQQAKSQMERA